MKKDVIYIDVEDDLTAIIEKLKNANASIVALVPPRRLGVLQSVVNLKLLKRAADEAGKKPVLITSDHSLTALTAGLNIPVARNLQSRPEIVPADAEPEGDTSDVIEGEAMNDEADAPASEKAAAQTPEPTGDEPKPGAAKRATPRPNKPRRKFKVPNFENFRKKLLLLGMVAVVLIGLVVWAFFIAPRATVTVKAQASKTNGSFTVTADANANNTNAANKVIQAQIREDKSNLSQKFTPTGKKDEGSKASGRITVRNCDYSNGFSLQAGSRFVSESGQTFVSTKSVSVPQFQGAASECSTSGSNAGTARVPVEASAIGDEYNINAQGYSLPGVSGKVDASGSKMTGGSKKTVTVVTQADVDKAKQALLGQNTAAEKQKLVKQFDNDTRALEDSFQAQPGDIAVDPGVGQEGNSATISIPITYSVLGLKNSDISAVLSSYFNGKIDDRQQQKLYDNGYKKLKIVMKSKESEKATMQFATDGYIGPNIDTDKLKPQLVGKRYAEIQDIIKSQGGTNVKDVNTKFWPFWVNTAPKAQKIKIDLKVANEQ